VPGQKEVLTKKAGYPILKIGLNPKPNILQKNIAVRLHKRLRQGMIHEVERLHKQGLSWKRLESLGLEYRYVALYLQDKISREEMITSLEKETWRYAKRQMTWFRRDASIYWINNPMKASILVKKFLKQ
jgi:tRNA dimethylallyltransferase